MEIKDNIVIAGDGKWLTQSRNVSDSNRIYTKQLQLGVNDSINNWKETDDAERNEYKKRIENKYSIENYII